MQCPSDYALHFTWENAPSCDSVYVVGGLYGNFYALEALKNIIEPNALVVLNGDIHWFDANVEQFRRIEEGIKPYIALNGNVEVELAREVKSGAGCGCFYPETTAEMTITWAHEIHARLSTMVDAHLQAYKEQFRKRSSCLGLFVGGCKIAITHGDESSLAGWMCSKEALREPQRQASLDAWFEKNSVDVLATTHTCEAVLLSLKNGVLINNGAAGLPNFQSPNSGMVTRISTTKAPKKRYGVRHKNLYIDAIDLAYDAQAFMRDFQRVWVKDSAAFLSYWKRVSQGVKRPISDVFLVAHDDTKRFEERISKQLSQTHSVHTMQLNLGRVCNLACQHCHVEASPNRKESMSQSVMQKALNAFKKHGFHTLDITGGAPEMNVHFEWLIQEATRVAKRIIVRTNLVILKEKRFVHLMEFYASRGIELVASLPDIQAQSVDTMRGKGVYSDSIDVIKTLNALGYGRSAALKLDFVYNPSGSSLPEAQSDLEAMFKAHLWEQEQIVFNRLFAITNVPIGRFANHLRHMGELDGYMTRLKTHFNPMTLKGIMCRSQISVAYDGRVYDCDFNQMLEMPIKQVRTIDDVLYAQSLKRYIAFGEHCYACTAGGGSGCYGAVVKG